MVMVGIMFISFPLIQGFDLQDEIQLAITYEVTERLYNLQLTATLARNGIDIVHSFDTDDVDEIPPTDPGRYVTTYTLPRRFLKAGAYNVRITSGTPERLIQDLESAVSFEVDERSENTHMKGYRRDRQGFVVSPGQWRTEAVDSETKVLP